MRIIAGFIRGREKRKLMQDAKNFMISETQKQPRTWHGMMTEEWMADFAIEKLKERKEEERNNG